jgi:plasmid stability protein
MPAKPKKVKSHVKVSTVINAELHKALKIRAAQDGLTIAEEIAGILDSAVGR